MACLSARPEVRACFRSSRAVRSRVRQLKVTTASLQNPYAALGLSATADAEQIKKAYRKLALKWHPDVSKQEGSETVFLGLTEAYEFLIGKLRGGNDAKEGSSSTDWDWHDWYWSFRTNRNWKKKQQEGAEPAQPKPAAAPRANIREQLAGLRQRAAIRATKARNSQFAESSRSSIDEEGCEPEEVYSHAASAAASATGEAASAAGAAAPAAGAAGTAAGAASLDHVEATTQAATADPSPRHDTFAFIDHPGAYRVDVDRSSRAEQHQQEAHKQGSSDFQGTQRRRFVAHSETRDNVRQQLAGLRRKAMIVSKAAPAEQPQP